MSQSFSSSLLENKKYVHYLIRHWKEVLTHSELLAPFLTEKENDLLQSLSDIDTTEPLMHDAVLTICRIIHRNREWHSPYYLFRNRYHKDLQDIDVIMEMLTQKVFVSLLKKDSPFTDTW
jgi:hypothetical protein